MKTKVVTAMFRAIRRSFTEGISGMAKNGLMTITSLLVVTACIFVFGVFLMCIFNINNMTSKMADDYQVDVYISRSIQLDDDSISVFVKRDANADDVAYYYALNDIKTLIMGVPNVNVSDINFVDSQTRIANFIAKLSDNEKATFIIPEGARILDSYTVTLSNPAAKIEAMRLLGQINGVSEVLDAEEAHHRLATLGGVTAGLSDEKYEEIKALLLADIEKIGNIDVDNIGFVNGKEKFKKFKSELTEEELKDFEGLPEDLIPDAYTVSLKDLSIADETIAELEALSHVESVENSRELISVIDSLKDIVQKISIWIIVAFALVSLFIISNTIKLTVHNRRKEINIMKYVGATDSYIRGPFIMEGILIGVLSAVLAFFISQWTYDGLMAAISSSASSFTANLGLMKFSSLWSKLLTAYVILGGVIGAFGSSISVRRYLNV